MKQIILKLRKPIPEVLIALFWLVGGVLLLMGACESFPAGIEETETASIAAKTERMQQRIIDTLVFQATLGPIDDKRDILKSGCMRHADGSVSQACSVQLSHSKTDATVCILDDGTVCLGECLICVRKSGDKWFEVNAWRGEK